MINPLKRTCKTQMYCIGVRQATRLTRLSSRVAFCRERNTLRTRKHRRTAVPAVQLKALKNLWRGVSGRLQLNLPNFPILFRLDLSQFLRYATCPTSRRSFKTSFHCYDSINCVAKKLIFNYLTNLYQLQLCFVQMILSKVKELHYIQRFKSYLTENTMCFQKKDQSFNFV